MGKALGYKKPVLVFPINIILQGIMFSQNIISFFISINYILLKKPLLMKSAAFSN